MRAPSTAPWLVLVVATAPCLAFAKPPECFPERFVLATAPVTNDDGELIGELDVDAVVRVLDDAVGPDGKSARVGFDGGPTLEGLMPRTLLGVRAGRDFPAIPGFLTFLRGAPMRLHREDGLVGELIRTSIPTCSLPRPPIRTTATCEDVTAVVASAEPDEPPAKSSKKAALRWVFDWRSEGRHALRDEAGHQLEVEASGYVIERRRTQTLVDVFEDGIRVRGLAENKLIRTRREQTDRIGIGLCIRGLRSVIWSRRDGEQWTAATTVTALELASPSGRRIAMLPRDTHVVVLGQKEGLSRVGTVWPFFGGGVSLVGWVPSVALRATTESFPAPPEGASRNLFGYDVEE